MNFPFSEKKIGLILLFLLMGSMLHSVVVSNVEELVTAIDNANNGGDKTIILKDGTYELNDILPIWVDGVTVRSESGNRNQVIIRGEGMSGGVTHIFNVAASNFTARDMTIGWVANHAVQIWGNNGASNSRLSNLRIVDTYEQMVKISYEPGNPSRSENGILENCLLEYTAGIGPQYYIGGIDGHQTRNWIIRNNTFKNIRSPSDTLAEHAVHFWSDSQGTLVEKNLIINCDRGIGFGLGDRGHSGGIIRNNMIYHNATEGFSDVSIGLENAGNTYVYNNSIYMENPYSNAIEYRFSGTSGGIIRNNLCNKAITSRDGGTATLSNNITNAQASWFTNYSTGNLHLASSVSQIVDQGIAISGLTDDYDGDSRPQGPGIDIGADERIQTTTQPTLTVTSPNGGENWTTSSQHSITWSSTGSVGNIKIEYSINNGSTWSTVASSNPNDGSYLWIVPDTPSQSCLIRIGEASDNSPSDSSNAPFTISQTIIKDAEITLNHSRLNFTAAGNSTTNPQTLTIDNTGTGTMIWTISETPSWLQCTPASGSNSQVITVSIDISGLIPGDYTGTISVSSNNAANSPQTIPVFLTVKGSNQGEVPFGEFATPVDGATVCSSIPVTGWVLDDVDVMGVQIFANGLFVGDAVFVEGARPDVETSYPNYPRNYRAGWGYMMLTYFLPGGGNGTYTLEALATDAEGNAISLGTKTINVDNIHAVKPFGAIDTPSQGGTASGNSFFNWGWVLTPQPSHIPTDGSTITVWVDGINLGHPSYNNYREDISTLFPGYWNHNGAVGLFRLDTTTYTNGVHNIHWFATDNAGNSDGIGSRYFTVQNSTPSRASVSRVHRAIPDRQILQLPVEKATPILFQKGYRSNAPFNEIMPDPDGMIRISIQQLERIAITLCTNPSCTTTSITAAFLEVNGLLKPLPAGITFLPKAGQFFWQPGPGFIGTYHFIFVRSDSIRKVSILIH